jgi:hypothetical protein
LSYWFIKIIIQRDDDVLLLHCCSILSAFCVLRKWISEWIEIVVFLIFQLVRIYFMHLYVCGAWIEILWQEFFWRMPHNLFYGKLGISAQQQITMIMHHVANILNSGAFVHDCIDQCCFVGMFIHLPHCLSNFCFMSSVEKQNTKNS